MNAVLISPTSASAWNGFFDYDSAHGPDGGAAQETRQGAMLGLLRWATELVQRPHAAGDAGAGEYVRLWLRLAREAERGSAEDARDTYKMLRRQRLAEGNAELYMAWAGLEERCSGPAQALDVVRKGLREGAQPAGPLNALAASLEAHLER